MSALCQFETFTLDAGLTGVGGGGPVFASNNEAPGGNLLLSGFQRTHPIAICLRGSCISAE